MAGHRAGRVRVLGRADSPDAAGSPGGLPGPRCRAAWRGLRGAVRHRRRAERWLRLPGSPHSLLRHAARASAGRRLHRPNAAARKRRIVGARRRGGAAAARRAQPGTQDGGSPCRDLRARPARTRRYLATLSGCPRIDRPRRRARSVSTPLAAAGGANRRRRVARPSSSVGSIRAAGEHPGRYAGCITRPYDHGPESPQVRQLRGVEARSPRYTLGLAALCGLYNAAAWLSRREQHLALNTVMYAALIAIEQRHVAHHIAELPVPPSTPPWRCDRSPAVR